jgi:hypothetical protein
LETKSITRALGRAFLSLFSDYPPVTELANKQKGIWATVGGFYYFD